MGDKICIQQLVFLAACSYSTFSFVCPIAYLEATSSTLSSPSP